MKAMMELKEMLCKELEDIAKKGELTAGGLETVHKLTDTIKNIDKIVMLEDDGDYSAAGEWDARGMSYDDGYSSARRGQHYVRGHYSRDGGEHSMRRDRMGRYSRADGMEHMMRTFGEMMEGADDKQRRIIQRAMDELRSV